MYETTRNAFLTYDRETKAGTRGGGGVRLSGEPHNEPVTNKGNKSKTKKVWTLSAKVGRRSTSPFAQHMQIYVFLSASITHINERELSFRTEMLKIGVECVCDVM